MSTASTLSFDGNGYLMPKQFGFSPSYGGATVFVQFVLSMRPNDETDALVMYAVDREVCVYYMHTCNNVNLGSSKYPAKFVNGSGSEEWSAESDDSSL